MNYRHIFHAGNICDVVKHSSYALLLDYMGRKDKAYAVLDTHAGCGLYDLLDERAGKTKEAEEGVQKIWEAREAVRELSPSYISVLEKMNPDGRLRFYPGSPLLAHEIMREQDRLIACELHAEDARILHKNLHGKAQIHHRDGYEAIKAFLPFPEKRGAVFIDPPFEKTDEIDQLVRAAVRVHARMPSSVLAIWYPIKDRPLIWKFHEALVEAGLPKILMAEFMMCSEERADRLNGSGLVLMNPPYQIGEKLEQLYGVLHKTLGTEDQKSTIKALTDL